MTLFFHCQSIDNVNYHDKIQATKKNNQPFPKVRITVHFFPARNLQTLTNIIYPSLACSMSTLTLGICRGGLYIIDPWEN